MDSSYPDPHSNEETDDQNTTTTQSDDESGTTSAADSADVPTTPQWRRLTVTLSASGVDTLPEMAISATHPTYSVSELPVSDTGNCTLWVPEAVSSLDIVLSFPATEQDDVSLTDLTVSEQDTITIPIVILSQ